MTLSVAMPVPGHALGNEQRALAVALQRMTSAVWHDPVGIGIDVVDVNDFEKRSIEKFPYFYSRCFSASEITYCRAQARPAQHFAVRFAAKEAAVKALASHTKLAYWQIEVVRQLNGQPTLALWTFDRLAPLTELCGLDLKVSLSHADQWAVALVAAFTRDHARV